MDNLIQEFNQLTVSKRKLQKKPVSKTKSNSLTKQVFPPLVVKVLVNPSILKINELKVSQDTNFCKINNALTYIVLDKNQKEFRKIKTLFANHNLRVNSVKKVNNPYLKKAFELNRHMKYYCIQSKTLYHGTKQENINSICTYNFDWRLGGSQKGYRHGKGVNFSASAYFATFFCERKRKKVMIIADVLVDTVTEGNENMVVPPRGNDTTTGKNETIFVKFYDNEFYPRYVVHFEKMC